jgi:hypothetical protein
VNDDGVPQITGLAAPVAIIVEKQKVSVVSRNEIDVGAVKLPDKVKRLSVFRGPLEIAWDTRHATDARIADRIADVPDKAVTRHAPNRIRVRR